MAGYEKAASMNIGLTKGNLQIRKIISKYSVSEGKKDGGQFEVSRHQHREILIPLQGSHIYMLNGMVYQFEPGIIGLVDRYMPHSPYYISSDRNLLQLWIRLYDDCIRGSIAKVYTVGKCEIVQTVSFPTELGQILHQRWDRLNQLRAVTPDIVMDFMKTPVEMVIDDFLLQSKYPASDRKKELLSDVLKDYIRACYGRNCSIPELEKITGYCASHISHTFQKETGESIRIFIDRVRLEYTMSALKNGMKQKEIAVELGFASPASFWNWLRKHGSSLKH